MRGQGTAAYLGTVLGGKNTMRHWRVLFVLGACIVLGLIVVWPRGVRVTVTNLGPDPLTEVVVYVTGNSYPLNTLEVGKSRTVKVQALSESDVELGFTGATGERRR